MSNEKNVQPAENKKESTSVLEKIRRRTGLLVGIVGLALLIFILESLLSSGQSIFGGGDASTIGVINGKKIDRNDFLMRVENQLNVIRQQKQSNDIDDATRSQVVDYVWQQMISDMVIKPEYNKVGITVGENEVYDKVVANPSPLISQRLTDQKTGRIYEQLAGPDGNLDRGKWKQFVQNAGPNEEGFIKQMEEDVKNTRYAEKYASLIRKGLYTTTAEAKEMSKTDNTSLSLTYVIKRFDTMSDSAVKVTDADIQKYYNDHSYEFKNIETTRKIEYVAFNVVPSADDLAAIQKDAERAAAEFKGKNLREDSSFIAQESQNGNITIQDFNKKSMIVRDSSIFTAPVGAVFGPYNEGAFFKIYKLEGVNSIADSAKVRHILIGTIDPQTQQPKKSNEQAKKQADSLLVLLKEKKVSFDTLVKTVSDDMGSKTNGGDYGWFDENKGFVQPFKDAGLMGTKGNISVIQTQFGYHIIEVLDVSKARHNSYRVAQIFKQIAPSDETNQKIFASANEFGGKHNSAELFDKGIREQKLAPRIADNIKESDKQLPGLEAAKELVRWTYSANKGDVAVFSFADKHIVAKLSGIKNRGTLPLEEVKDDVIAKVTLEKKSELFMNEFKNKAAGSKSASEYAAKLGLEPKAVEKLMAAGHNVEGLGHDDILIGTALGTKAGQTSKPVIGDNGVFVLTVNNVNTATASADVKMKQRQVEQMQGGRADYEAFNALKELAEIEDHKSRVD
ncbi:MAG: SurA N-terminal domain-containing protein [Bacteroidetes bacterium]|nr:SurA N-terminal domain-containing protein [Bacteroidota bacterium]